MEIKINNQLFDIPTDLSQFTLGQFLNYWDMAGRQLDLDLKAILEKNYDDEFERIIDLFEQELKEAIAWYSSFTGYDFSTIAGEQADALMKQYRLVRALISDSEAEQYKQFPFKIRWRNVWWRITDWKVTASTELSFNELLVSKEVTRQIYSLGKGKWDALPYLCAVFFRKMKEKFTDALVDPAGDRMKLMLELPMEHAIRVAFFLTISVNICTSILAFSKGPLTPTDPWSNTSTDGAG